MLFSKMRHFILIVGLLVSTVAVPSNQKSNVSYLGLAFGFLSGLWVANKIPKLFFGLKPVDQSKPVFIAYLTAGLGLMVGNKFVYNSFFGK